jgi:hypothetical protein
MLTMMISILAHLCRRIFDLQRSRFPSSWLSDLRRGFIPGIKAEILERVRSTVVLPACSSGIDSVVVATSFRHDFVSR